MTPSNSDIPAAKEVVQSTVERPNVFRRAVGKVVKGVRGACKTAAIPLMIATTAFGGCKGAEKAANELVEEGTQLLEAGGDMLGATGDLVSCPTGTLVMTTPECRDEKNNFVAGSIDDVRRLQGEKLQAICELGLAEDELVTATDAYHDAKNEEAARKEARGNAVDKVDESEDTLDSLEEQIVALNKKIKTEDPDIVRVMGYKEDLAKLQAKFVDVKRDKSKAIHDGSTDEPTMKKWDKAEAEYREAVLKVRALKCQIAETDRDISAKERRAK